MASVKFFIDFDFAIIALSKIQRTVSRESASNGVSGRKMREFPLLHADME